jgi:cell division protein FtsW (lipid II flippase)
LALRQPRSGLIFFLILLFQVLGGLQLFFSMGAEVNPTVPLSFFLFILAECVHYSILNWRGWEHLELELLCYFLCGLSLSVTASATPDSLFTQLGAILLGFAVYTVLVVILRDLERAERLKYFLAAVALLLLALNLAMGETRFGAKRWLSLGIVTFQPSEFVKIAFVLVGTATLDKLLTTRNMSAFIGFSVVCIGALVLMRDLGTVVVFFGTFIVIAFMRSGDLRTIAFAATGAALGALAAVSFLPYIASRFAVWGKVWEHAGTSGYQQTRTMIAAASGGLLGVGGGEGYLARVAAADTDLIFGLLAEEWGLIVALTAVLIPVFFAFYATFLTKDCRSSFYAIAACGAASIFLIQTALNVLGSVDIIPLTGITVSFVSRGGSSMVASWGLLALIKSADDNRARPVKRRREKRRH